MAKKKSYQPKQILRLAKDAILFDILFRFTYWLKFKT